MKFIIPTVLAVICLLSLSGFSQSDEGLKLTVEPRYLQFNTDVTREGKVLCVLRDTAGRKVELSGCQFIVDDENNHIYEFANGPSSPASTSGVFTGRYHGNGLKHGECGIAITGFGDWDLRIVGCRVRTSRVKSTWIYQQMMFYAITRPPLQFNLQPQVTTAKAGTSVSFNGVAEDKLNQCWFYLPSVNNTVSLNFHPGLASDEQHSARYHGRGLEHKQCGITLLNVQPNRSGFVIGLVWSYVTLPYRISWDFTQLIVLTAPEAPLLTVTTTDLLVPGQVLQATCVVKNSRPVANLTWFLGDEVIREDNINEAPLDSKWRWGHDLQTMEQHLEHVVTSSDNGKKLKCKASHVALASGSQDSTSRTIRVRGACGLSTLTTSLVHGGTNTQRGAWPWLAALFDDDDNEFFCGGSLISNKHVLTAAHCVRNVDKTYAKEQIFVVLGKYELSKSHERYTERRDVHLLHVHDSFEKARTSLYDIALLELDEKVHYNRFIQPVCVWTSNPASSRDQPTGTVVGWGQTENDPVITNTPKQVKVGIVSQETCRRSFPLLTLFTNNHTLCAGFKNGTGPCTGDSGGPLMVSTPLGNGVQQWYLRGIVSTAIRLNETCNLQQYVVYTDVSKFSSWLSERMT